MEVADKLESEVGRAGSVLQWPAVLSLLFMMSTNGCWFFDEVAVPDVTMYEVVTAIVETIGALFAAPIFGLGISLTAALIEHASQKYGCNHMTLLLTIGPPGIMISFVTSMVVLSVVNPFMYVAGQNSTAGQMVFPDDGLEPNFARRCFKIQVVLLAVMTFVGIWAGLVRRK